MLTIECTPAIVNKTAIHRIVRETIAYLSNSNAAIQLRSISKIYKNWTYIENESKIPFKMNLLLRFPKLILPLFNLLNLLNHKKVKSPVLYFDPLYTLFYPLKKSDYVFVLDLTPITIPEFHPPHTVWLYRQAFRKLQNSTCTIISISQSTTNDLRVNLGLRVERIKPIRLFANPQLVASASLPTKLTVQSKKFLLFVGSLEIRKNIKGLLDAFDVSQLHTKNIHLVIVGRVGFRGTDILHLFKTLHNVHWVGAISDSELAWYYENCLAFVYPSFWEGFGVPLLEALQYNCPCLCTMTGASPEVGGNAVVYCDPCDINSISKGLVEIVRISENPVSKNLLLKSKDSILNQFSKINFNQDLKTILNGDKKLI